MRVMCASGVRSALAHRILAQAGFDSATLSGRMPTLRATLGDKAGELLQAPADPTQSPYTAPSQKDEHHDDH